METLEGLYEYAHNANITIDAFNLKNKKAFAIEEVSGERAVVIDRSKIEGYREEKVVLSEELGHLDCDALCFIHDYTNPLRYLNVRKAEYRATAWAYQHLIPYRELKNALKNEDNPYLVADFFDVPYTFLQKTLEFYRKKGRSI